MGKAAWIIVVLLVAIAAFVVGRQSGSPQPAPQAAAVPAPTPAPQPTAGATGEAISAAPPQTYRGPDGRPHLISYEAGKSLDSSDPALVKAAVLADMRNHPKNIQRAYDLEPADIEAILNGGRAFPDSLLPAPRPETSPR